MLSLLGKCFACSVIFGLGAGSIMLAIFIFFSILAGR